MTSIDFGAMHQSNGLGSTNERSWNRIYLNFTFHLTNNWVLSVRPWYRIHALEDEDYNLNITKYLGDGDLRISYTFNNFMVYLLLRNEIESGFSRGAEELDFAFPFFHHIHGFVQAFSGYGQSLISYNHPTNSIGVGFSLFGPHTPNI
jgi:phospholipase A1